MTITKTNQEVSEPFWPAPRTQLDVSFGPHADQPFVALGRVPGNSAIVFRADLQPSQQTAFLHAVSVGARGESWTNSTNIPINSVVVITGPGSGDGTGPKFLVRL